MAEAAPLDQDRDQAAQLAPAELVAQLTQAEETAAAEPLGRQATRAQHKTRPALTCRSLLRLSWAAQG